MEKRPPVSILDLVILLEVLPDQGEIGLAILTAALVAFWVTARLVELLLENTKNILLKWDNLDWATDQSHFSISIHNAKTAKPQEVQSIYVQRQNLVLDLVSILEEWFAFRPRNLSDKIFSVWVKNKKKRLGKEATINHPRLVCNARRPKEKQLLHGDSF